MQRVLLAVGTCRVKTLDITLELTLTQECHHGFSNLPSKEPKLERDSGCVEMSVLWLAVAILQMLLEGRVHVQQSSHETILGSHQLASTEPVRSAGTLAVSFVQGLAKQHSQPMLWLWSEHGGPTTTAASCDSSARNGNRHGTCSAKSHSSSSRNGNRGAREGQESSQKASAALNRQTRGSKKQLPEEQGREVAQGII